MEVKNKTDVSELDTTVSTVEAAPRKLTFAENVIGTIKVLGILALIGAVLWGLESWVTAR